MARLGHHDLASFLRYANAGNIDQTSFLFRGTLYEYIVQEALGKRLAKSGLSPLKAVGGSSDLGVDLVGDWPPLQAATESEPASGLRLLVQCKSSVSKVPSSIWRELVGVHMHHAPDVPAIVLLASPAPMTKQGLASFNTLNVPFAYCQVKMIWPRYDETKQKSVVPISASTIQALTTNKAGGTLFEKYGIKLK